MSQQITARYYASLILIVSVLLLTGGVSGSVAGAGSELSEDLNAGTISSDVSTGNGTQEMLVYFESVSSEEDLDAMGKQDLSDITVDRLTEHAKTTQEPFEQYAAETEGVSINRSFWLGNAALVTIDTERVAVSDLAELDGVEHIGPNAEVQINTTVRDKRAGATSQFSGPSNAGMPSTLFSPLEPQFTSQTSVTANDVTYGLNQINAPAVWNEYGTRGEGTAIAVLDTGVDPDHPDIELHAWGDWDQYGNERNTEPKDYGTHGTHVSGTVAGGNASGTHVGVAPETELYHGAVLTNCDSSSCAGTGAQILAGMQWAVENDVDVISMSLGVEGYNDGFIRPIRDAQNAGTMVVAAAGNAGEGTSNSPGNIYDATSIGASDQNRAIADFSSGELVDDWSDPPADWPDAYVVPTVSAPGVLVNSTVPGGGYVKLSGTSMATPHVAGAVGLIQSATEKELSPAELKAALADTATKTDGEPDGQDVRYGHGIIDAKAAIDSVVEQPAQFNVSVASTNSPIIENGTLEVAATVTNFGGTADTQSITLDVGEDRTDETALSLDSGESETVSLVWDTEMGDSGDYDAVVSSVDDSTSTDVTVRRQAVFVSINETNSPVFTNETLTVNATVESTVGNNQTHPIQLLTDEIVRDEQNITLEQGEMTQIQLAWQTKVGDHGTHDVTLASESDTDSVPVFVEKPGEFDVEIDAIDSPVAEGETLSVDTTVKNLGNGTATQSVRLITNDTRRDVTSLTLAPGNTTTTTLSWTTTGGDAGTHNITVQSEDDSETAAIVVTETAPVAVDITGTNTPVTENETLTVDVALQNNGSVTTTQSIRLLVDDVEYDSKTITLGPGNTTSDTFEWQTEHGDAGERILTIASVHHTASVNTTVESAEPVVGDYTGEDGVVGTTELRHAIRDWRTSDIDTDLLRNVIRAWRSGESVA